MMKQESGLPLVSIIVPVYNVEPYIRKCLESLVHINYHNIEIILVDDCGNDDSVKICEEFCEKYKEIILWRHKENQGVSQARITGLECSKGKYIMFVDADDTVCPEIINILVEKAMEEDADIVSGGVFYRDDNKMYPEKRSISGSYDKKGIQQLFNDRLLYDINIKSSGMPLYLCGKLFKRCLLFDSLQEAKGFRYGEDIVVIFDLLINKVNRLVCLEDCFYEYYHHSEQVTSSGLLKLWPDYEKLWKHIDNIGFNGMSRQLSLRMWSFLKPSVYDAPKDWGNVKKYISIFKNVRASQIVSKYIFKNSQLPKSTKRHPHYFFLKYRLYLLDYLFYRIMWAKYHK